MSGEGPNISSASSSSSKRRKLDFLGEELVNTERTLLANLNKLSVVKDFCAEFRVSSRWQELSADEKQAIDNLEKYIILCESIRASGNQFLEQLHDKNKFTLSGDMEAIKTAYIKHLNEISVAVTFFQQNKLDVLPSILDQQTMEQIDKKLKGNKTQLPLESILIQPVQRIPRYMLLFKDFNKTAEDFKKEKEPFNRVEANEAKNIDDFLKLTAPKADSVNSNIALLTDIKEVSTASQWTKILSDAKERVSKGHDISVALPSIEDAFNTQIATAKQRVSQSSRSSKVEIEQATGLLKLERSLQTQINNMKILNALNAKNAASVEQVILNSTLMNITTREEWTRYINTVVDNVYKRIDINIGAIQKRLTAQVEAAEKVQNKRGMFGFGRLRTQAKEARLFIRAAEEFNKTLNNLKIYQNPEQRPVGVPKEKVNSQDFKNPEGQAKLAADILAHRESRGNSSNLAKRPAPIGPSLPRATGPLQKDSKLVPPPSLITPELSEEEKSSIVRRPGGHGQTK